MDKFYFAVESQSTVTVAEAIQAVSSASPLPSHLKDFALLMGLEDSHSKGKRDLLEDDFMGLALVDKHNAMEVLKAGSTATMISLKDENVQLNGRCLQLEKSAENHKSMVAAIKHQRDEAGRELSSALAQNGSLRTENRILYDALARRLNSMEDSMASVRNEAVVARQEAAAARQDAAAARQDAAAARQDAAVVTQRVTKAAKEVATAGQHAAVATQRATAATEQLSALQATVDRLVASTALSVI
jgi:chromosome segregation ATPase